MGRFVVIVKDRENKGNNFKMSTDCIVGALQQDDRTGSRAVVMSIVEPSVLMDTCRVVMETCRKSLAQLLPNDMCFKKILVDMFEDELKEDDEGGEENES